MALKTLLVCLMNRESADAVLNCAVPLARAHGAHLIGLHTFEALLVYPGIAMHVPGIAFASFDESQKEEAAIIEAIFRKHTENEDFPSEWRPIQTETASASECMIQSAHAADLVIMPRDGTPIPSGAQVRVIQECGRPVIVVPPDFNGPQVGANVVLGWSNTREAARAAHDLLLVAQARSKISVVRVDGRSGDELADSETIDLAEMFDRHGLRAQTAHRKLTGNDVAEALLQHAMEEGADLVAAGAFGHSRAYDFFVGAVTKTLMQKATMPVLLSS